MSFHLHVFHIKQHCYINNSHIINYRNIKKKLTFCQRFILIQHIQFFNYYNNLHQETITKYIKMYFVSNHLFQITCANIHTNDVPMPHLVAPITIVGCAQKTKMRPILRITINFHLEYQHFSIYHFQPHILNKHKLGFHSKTCKPTYTKMSTIFSEVSYTH